MPVPSDPFNFSNGATADADQVDARFLELYRALNPAQVGIDNANIAANAGIVGSKLAAATIAEDRLASPALGAWKTLWTPSLQKVAVNMTSETSLCFLSGSSTVGAGGAGLYLEEDDFAIAGKVTKIRMRAWSLIGNGGGGAVTLTLRLRRITGPGVGQPTAWAAADLSLVLDGPVGNSQDQDVTSEITIPPTAGIYDVTGQLSAGISGGSVGVMLQIRHV